jgi:hypothetical protein
VRRRFILPAMLVLAQDPGVRPEPRYFQYQRVVTVTDSAAGRQSCVPLDMPVFHHASPALADLRLFHGAREVPYAIHVAGATVPAASTRPAVLNLGQRNGKIVFDAHILEPSYRTIELEIDARDFLASVEVLGSQSSDGSHATRLGVFTIFDLTSQQLNRSTVIHLPASNFPYLHFTVDGALRTRDVRGLSILDGASAPSVYHPVATVRHAESRSRASVMTFDVPARVPVERIELGVNASSGNFSRSIHVDAKWGEATSRGRTLVNASGTIARVHTTRGAFRLDREQLSLDLPHGAGLADTGVVRWVITVANGDDVPLAIERAELMMRERHLCFAGTMAGAYTLYYGDPALRAPQYDYARLFEIASKMQRLPLSAEQPNANVQPRPDTRPFTERYPAILWGAFGVVLIVLGGIAVRTARRIDS